MLGIVVNVSISHIIEEIPIYNHSPQIASHQENNKDLDFGVISNTRRYEL